MNQAQVAEPASGAHRQSLRKAREGRREEIQQRWDERRATLFFVDSYASTSRVDRVVDNLIYFSKWASPGKLLDAVDLPAHGRSVLLERLVRVIVLKEMPYDEYLRTDEWQTKATAAKQRYAGRCALDATHPAEHAHHRTYDRRGRESDNDIIPLCGACHAKFHNRRP